MCILDISKVLMYNFYYKIMKEQYGENIKLLFSDTDSICFEVKTNDLYEDMKNNKDLYDFSGYPKTHFYMMKQIKKRVGVMKDETKSYPIQEFIGLRPKLYSFKTYVKNEKKEKNTSKGVKKCVASVDMIHEDYFKCFLVKPEKKKNNK